MINYYNFIIAQNNLSISVDILPPVPWAVGLGARSSVVERYIDIVEIRGSIPLAPITLSVTHLLWKYQLFLKTTI